jgi:hypothetical protein
MIMGNKDNSVEKLLNIFPDRSIKPILQIK